MLCISSDFLLHDFLHLLEHIRLGKVDWGFLLRVVLVKLQTHVDERLRARGCGELQFSFCLLGKRHSVTERVYLSSVQEKPVSWKSISQEVML
jgi:hypothetical protein